ncbi:MAG: hypothetical protein ACU836_13820 [Gammaproteobacteria bacterium]
MASDNAKIEKKKVALNQNTYDRLKDFSRFNGLKLRLVVDTLVELLESDETLSQQVIERTLAKQENDKM